MYRFLKLILILAWLGGCSSALRAEPQVFVLDYRDFGPQAVAYEFIGMEWWQWDSHGDTEPRVYDIKVVVYRDVSLNDVKLRYPINEASLMDYRYVTYGNAIAFLDRHIEEDVLPEITSVLRNTKARLTAP